MDELEIISNRLTDEWETPCKAISPEDAIYLATKLLQTLRDISINNTMNKTEMARINCEAKVAITQIEAATTVTLSKLAKTHEERMRMLSIIESVLFSPIYQDNPKVLEFCENLFKGTRLGVYE